MAGEAREAITARRDALLQHGVDPASPEIRDLEAALHRIDRPHPRIVQQAGGTTLHEPVPGTCCQLHQHHGQAVPACRVIEHGQRPLEAGHAFHHQAIQ